MSQADFADKCGISPGQPTNYISGKRTPPPEKIEDMIRVLKVSEQDADEFRQAAALAHVPEGLRQLDWLTRYAEDRAAAERRGVFMAFAALRRFAPAHAEALIAAWRTWPEDETGCAALLQALPDNQEPRRKP